MASVPTSWTFSALSSLNSGSYGPMTKVPVSFYDHAEERAWRHLDTGGFPTWLHARPPRVKCPAHGVRQVDLPWAEPKSRFTRPSSASPSTC